GRGRRRVRDICPCWLATSAGGRNPAANNLYAAASHWRVAAVLGRDSARTRAWRRRSGAHIVVRTRPAPKLPPRAPSPEVHSALFGGVTRRCLEDAVTTRCRGSGDRPWSGASGL